MKKLSFVFGLLALLALASCEKPIGVPEVENQGLKGLFVLNEGTFTFANSTLTFYDPEADTSMNSMFYRVNEVPIGDVGQSLSLFNESLYIVVNNSNLIYKVNASTLEFQDKFDGFYSPRNILSVSKDKAYVSDLMGNGIWIVNPTTGQKKGFLETGKPTEAMLKVGNEIFVTNWSNYYQPDVENNTVQVIDVLNDSLVAQIQVSKEPNSLVLDAKNRLWVLCGGGYTGALEPALFCIDAETKTILKSFQFESGSPSSLAIDRDNGILYFINGGLYAMSVDASALPSNPFVEAGLRSFYGVTVCPETHDVFVTDVKNYIQNGEVLRYSAEGRLKSSFMAGIIPHAMIFN
jgi:hypothetical protein